MGSGASVRRPQTKRIYLCFNGKQITAELSTSCTTQDLKELLTSAAGVNRWSTITLMNKDGCLIPITSALPANTPITCYELSHINERRDDDKMNEVMMKLSEEFSKAFKIEQFISQFSERLDALERRFEVEGNRTVEIDKCKQELQKLTGSLFTKQTTMRSLELEQQALRSRGITHYPKYILTQETINYLKKPTFDIWHWEQNEMLSLMEHMYHELGLLSELKINPITLRRWLLSIQENYRDNPFHNFRHCFCVTQMMYGMIHLCGLLKVFTKLEIAILITSAVCHDLDHPGFTNSYQINARTELAIRYNDKSPLENHHCAVAFEILENPETNIFAYVSPECFKKIRQGMIDLILATDMAKHGEIIENFKQVLVKGFDHEDENHRTKLKMILIKCCDISNEVRPMEVSEPWVDCLLEEYFMQSDREKAQGLPVAPFMDRDKVTKPTAQIGFIRFVLIPLFELMKQLFPQVEEAMIQPLKSSLDHYEHLKMMEDIIIEEKSNASVSKSQCDSSKEMIAAPVQLTSNANIKL